MTAKYRLLALDMDGTLLNDEQKITPLTVEWIKKRWRPAYMSACLRDAPRAVRCLMLNSLASTLR